jgi:hypothetical protein
MLTQDAPTPQSPKADSQRRLANWDQKDTFHEDKTDQKRAELIIGHVLPAKMESVEVSTLFPHTSDSTGFI